MENLELWEKARVDKSNEKVFEIEGVEDLFCLLENPPRELKPTTVELKREREMPTTFETKAPLLSI